MPKEPCHTCVEPCTLPLIRTSMQDRLVHIVLDLQSSKEERYCNPEIYIDIFIYILLDLIDKLFNLLPSILPEQPYLLSVEPCRECQKSPTICSKIATICQKSPTMCQKSPTKDRDGHDLWSGSSIFGRALLT